MIFYKNILQWGVYKIFKVQSFRNYLLSEQEYIRLIVVTLFGGLIRLYPALIASFPIGDGGLFYVMAQELQASPLSLPFFTSYNGGQIPFVYPPLGHYLLVLFSELFQTPLITMMRLLPPIISVLTIPAFYFLARSLLNEKSTAFISTCAFTILPPAFDWLIMGGSITRTPGFLFALLAINQVFLLFKHGHKLNLVLSIVFSSLTIYSHPAMSWFVLYTSIIFFISMYPNLKKLGLSLIVAVSVILVTSPWWFTSVAHFGFQPLINGLRVGTGSISGWTFFLPLLFLFTHEPLLDLQAILGLLGLMVAVRERKFMLVAWFLLIFVLQTKESAVVASIPLAIFVGLSIDHLILHGLGETRFERNDQIHRGINLSQILFLIYILVVGLFSVYFVSSSMKPISPGDIAAMSWIKDNTPSDSRFLIILGEKPYNINVSEWFPALTQRVSLNTGEGMEWLTNKIGKSDQATFDKLQTCTLKTVSCLEEWVFHSENYWDYLYLTVNAASMADGSTSRLFNSMLNSPSYELIFENKSVYIFKNIFPEKFSFLPLGNPLSMKSLTAHLE